MPTIEEELRSVFDGYAGQDAPPVDRRFAVGRRIKRRRRVRATAGAFAVILGVVVASSTALAVRPQHAGRPRLSPINGAPSTSAAAGHLPTYAGGGRLQRSSTITMPAKSSVSVTFTPTNWTFMIGDACATADPKMLIAVTVNGHDLTSSSCAPDGGPSVGAPGDFDSHQSAWEAVGVRLGHPTTVTAVVGTKAKTATDFHLTPTTRSGVASIGIYSSVSWDAYPHPSTTSSDGLGTPIANLPHRQAVFDGTSATTAAITLQRQIQVTASTDGPGEISVYLNNVKLDEYDNWDTSEGYIGGVQTVGSGRLAGFTVGETVTVTVLTRNFGAENEWKVWLAGS